MDNTSKLWPVNQLLEWLEKIESEKMVNVKSPELCTILAILKFADNKTWKAYPSVKTIAKMTCRTKDNCDDILKKLIAKKIFSVKERFKTNGSYDNNEYNFHVDNFFKVGAFSPLGWGRKHPQGGGGFTPLTTYRTNHSTKKKEICSKNENEKLISEPRATHVSPILEEYMRKKK